MKHEKSRHEEIHLGTHGEDYGSWMSNPVFYMIGGLLALSVVLAVLSFTVFRLPWLGAVFSVAAAAFLALLCWCGWIRKQYAFGGGGMMERTHQCLLAHLGFDGKGTLLDVGCGSGALAEFLKRFRIRQKNAASEGVATRCRFQHGDAHQLDFPDDTFDAVVSNYVYHNITGADKQALLRETLRVLKPGGVFALNDDMKPRMYGDMEAFAQDLREAGFQEVRLVDTATEVFGSQRRAAMMMLGESRMLVGRK